ncbi:fungal-specific transcription factor domain-containing protein, partial [Tricladium varicosporioides]
RTRNRQSRGRGLRKTTGCIICRKRHVKCDEAKPACRRCDKIGETCTYGPAKVEDGSRKEAVPQAMIYDPPRDQAIPRWPGSPDQMIRFSQPISDSGADTTTQGNQPPQELPNVQIQADFAIGLQSNVPSDPINQQVVSPEQLSNYAQTPYSMHSNDSLLQRSTYQPTFNVAIAKWFDMLVGDATFENGVPGFDINLENLNNIDSPLDQDGSRVPSIRRQSSNIEVNPHPVLSPASCSPHLLERNPPPLDVAAEKQQWQASDTIELLPHENFVFKNFVQRISHWIDLFDPTQSFSTFVPHLAMRNIGLMKAILALSTRHLSQNPGISGDQRHHRNDALQYYNETLHYISKAMQYDTYKTSLELLATALIVSTYEMLDGSGKDWERHLQGVFWIQRSQIIHGDSKGLKQAVWWAWLCQDIWAAFREKRKCFTFWKPQRTFDVLNPYELAARSVYLMAQVVSYCSRDENDDSIIDIKARMDKADRLTDMLDDWQRHLTTEFTPLPSDKYSTSEPFQPIWIHPPAFGVALQLHYSARLLLLLNRPSRGGFGGYLEQGRRISSLVSKICGIAMTLTDNASSVMSSQCLYIASMCIQDSRQRQAALTMIDSCRQRTGWPIKSLGEELQAFWD